MKPLMMSCKEIVKSVNSEESQTWLQRGQVRLHLLMCKHCGRYAKQLRILNGAFATFLNSKSATPDPGQVTRLEDQILKSIKK